MALSATLLLDCSFCTKVAFEEYNLDNGLHVILQNDPSAPVVITSVMYHVGAKKRKSKELVLPIFRTFLFEGTENINVENGLKCDWKQITPTPPKTVLIITKYSI
jgi:hypothetical protein